MGISTCISRSGKREFSMTHSLENLLFIFIKKSVEELVSVSGQVSVTATSDCPSWFKSGTGTY